LWIAIRLAGTNAFYSQLLLTSCFDAPGQKHRSCEIAIGKGEAGKKAARR
jgi:hypothetical protein